MQPVPWARVDAVGVAPITAGRGREDNGGWGGVVAIVVDAESQPEPTSSPAAREPDVLQPPADIGFATNLTMAE